MHHHLEIIMPPVDNVEEAIKQILEPFDEGGKDEDGHPNPHGFWDWWVIGGRWAGHKLEAGFDQEKLEAFHQELTKREVTVSGLQAGKPSLEPASQIPMVDALWAEFFPDSPTKSCPLFSHYNDQYRSSAAYPDVMRLKDIPKGLTASHVIIAGPHWDSDRNSLEAKYMLQESIWNGVTFVESKWDGDVEEAISQHKEHLKNAKPEYAAKHIPQDDWLVVTVDYHS